MPRILFIADIHLCQDKPAITAIFLHFLQTVAQQCDALYLLGDLFETWIGDDNPNPLYQQIANAINKLPIPKFFIHGNRDFLIGQRFAHASGMTLLPDEQVLTLYGQRVLIMHGDTLCTDDESYQRFRAKVRQYWLQHLFLSLPLRLRMFISTRIRADSKKTNQHKSVSIMDVNQQTVESVMTRQQVNMLIHGHTHHPTIYDFNLHGKIAHRAVLGAWHHNYGSIIQIDPSGISFIDFPF